MSSSEVEDDVTSRRLGRDQGPDCYAAMTTKPTSDREDEVKSERSGRQQDWDFQCNDHEMCDEEDDVISDRDEDDDLAFEKEDNATYDGDDANDEEYDELCNSFGLEHQTPGLRQQQQSNA